MAKLKVMSWNLENLFSFGHPSAPKTAREYRQKLESLAAVISRLDPDILAVQEVGDIEAFNELVALLDDRYPYLQLSDFPDVRGIRVGFISKLAIAKAEDIKDLPPAGLSKIVGHSEDGTTEISQLGRGALRILVKPKPDFFLHLINVHFKSKLLSYPSTTNRPRFSPSNENERARVAGLALLKRTAEAVAIRVKANQILENDNSQALIVLGDLNDVPSAATTQIIQGTRGSEIGTRGFKLPDKGDDARLFNLAPLIDPQRRYSRIYRQNKELIDHIFVSQELLSDRDENLPMVDSYIDFADNMPSIDDDPIHRKNKPSSDHAPITAIFDL